MLDVERAGSIAAAANTLRTDIQLPGALRQLGGLTRAVHAALRGVRGLEPERLGLCAPTLAGFAVALGIVPDADTSAAGSVLVALRSVAAAHLHRLPAPLVFDPCRVRAGRRRSGFQHEVRADRPDDVVEPRDPATASAPVRPPRGSSPSMNDTEQDLIERIAVFRRGRPGGAAQARAGRACHHERPGRVRTTRGERAHPRRTARHPEQPAHARGRLDLARLGARLPKRRLQRLEADPALRCRAAACARARGCRGPARGQGGEPVAVDPRGHRRGAHHRRGRPRRAAATLDRAPAAASPRPHRRGRRPRHGRRRSAPLRLSRGDWRKGEKLVCWRSERAALEHSGPQYCCPRSHTRQTTT